MDTEQLSVEIWVKNIYFTLYIFKKNNLMITLLNYYNDDKN